MNKIHKVQIAPDDKQHQVTVPKDSHFIAAKALYDGILVYYTFSAASSGTEERTILVVLTGQEYDFHTTRYIDTVMLLDGRYVAHVFEVAP